MARFINKQQANKEACLVTLEKGQIVPLKNYSEGRTMKKNTYICKVTFNKGCFMIMFGVRFFGVGFLWLFTFYATRVDIVWHVPYSDRDHAFTPWQLNPAICSLCGKDHNYAKA